MLLSALPALPGAQVGPYREFTREALTPGIYRGQLSLSTERGTALIEFLEADTNLPRVSLAGVLSGSNPHESQSLTALADGASALALAPLDAGPDPHHPASLGGIRIAGDRLYSWSANESAPHLLIYPEGTMEFRSPDLGAAAISFDDGTSLPLRSINGPLAGVGEGSFLTGRAVARQLPLAALPPEVIALVARPLQPSDPHEAFHLESGGRFEFVEATTVGRLRLDPPDVALLLPEGSDPALERRARRRERFAVRVALTGAWRHASHALPVAGMLMRGGVLAPGVDPAAPADNFIAVNGSGTRLLAGSTVTDAGRRFSVAAADVVFFLAEQGFTDAALLPAGVPPVLADAGDRRLRQLIGGRETRLALAALAREPVLRAEGAPEGLRRIEGLVIGGTLREFPLNFANSLVDGRLKPTTTLGEFWAAPISREGTNQDRTVAPDSIKILLPRPLPVAAIELVHAESAGFSPEFNLKGWRLFGRASAGEPWTELLARSHREPTARERVPLPGTPLLRELQLEVVEPNFFPAGNVARIAELILWSPSELLPAATAAPR